jgi:hypothetical protein
VSGALSVSAASLKYPALVTMLLLALYFYITLQARICSECSGKRL